MSNDLHAVIRQGRTDFEAYVETTFVAADEPDAPGANLIEVVARLISEVKVLYSVVDALASNVDGVGDPTP